MRKLLGLRIKRHVAAKEVIIENPDYEKDAAQLQSISREIQEYSQQHRLKSAPNWIKVFFKYEPDHAIEHINEKLESVIEDLGNTKSGIIINELNTYPVISEKAHTRPFDRKWLNIAAAVIVPLGVILYIRMWRYRLRLFQDLKNIKNTNDRIIAQINKM